VLGKILDTAEQMFGRPLTNTEISLVTRMHSAGKDWDYIAKILAEATPREPTDDELVTTRYEAAVGRAIEIP
jgi:hypothetical protein